MNPHHRRTKSHARDFGLECAFVFAREMGHIGGCASHVEADHFVESSALRNSRRANNAAGRS